MKSKLYYLIIFAIMLMACGGAGEPTAISTDPLVPTTEPPPLPSDTPQPPPPTETDPPPTNTPVPDPWLFRDDFDGSLGEGWEWYAEVPEKWNLSDVPGFLRIIAQNGGLNGGEPHNLLLYPVPAGDFVISTRMNFTPTSNFQFAGLIVIQSETSFSQFGRAYAACDAAFCVGNGIYTDNILEGQYLGSNLATSVLEPTITYLRLEKRGNVYTGFFSADGVSWIEIGSNTNDMAPLKVGLVAHQAHEEEIAADFDYFMIEAIP